MYNGIGLTTPRGSGTSGYVQRNLSNLRMTQKRADYARQEDLKPPAPKKPNIEVMEHKRKREIEVKCMYMREEMAEKGFSEDEIEKNVATLRKRLDRVSRDKPFANQIGETHGRAAVKERESAQMERALGLDGNSKMRAEEDRRRREERYHEYEERRKYERQERKRHRSDRADRVDQDDRHRSRHRQESRSRRHARDDGEDRGDREDREDRRPSKRDDRTKPESDRGVEGGSPEHRDEREKHDSEKSHRKSDSDKEKT